MESMGGWVSCLVDERSEGVLHTSMSLNGDRVCVSQRRSGISLGMFRHCKVRSQIFIGMSTCCDDYREEPETLTGIRIVDWRVCNGVQHMVGEWTREYHMGSKLLAI